MILAYFFTFRNALERKFKRHQKYSKIRDVRPPRPTYVTYAVTRVSRMHLPNHNPIQNQKPNQNTSSMHQLQTSAKSTGTHTITKTNTITNTTNFAQTKIIFFHWLSSFVAIEFELHIFFATPVKRTKFNLGPWIRPRYLFDDFWIFFEATWKNALFFMTKFDWGKVSILALSAIPCGQQRQCGLCNVIWDDIMW